MTDSDIRAACARFMGWRVGTVDWYRSTPNGQWDPITNPADAWGLLVKAAKLRLRWMFAQHSHFTDSFVVNLPSGGGVFDYGSDEEAAMLRALSTAIAQWQVEKEAGSSE